MIARVAAGSGALLLLAAALVTGGLTVDRDHQLATWTKPPLTGDDEASVVPVDSLAQAIEEGALFRALRKPAPNRYSPDAPLVAPVPAIPRPSLRLTGIVWGNRPSAVVEGVPGTSAPTVMRVGEVVSGIRLLQLDQTRATLAGMDTTWSLTVRVPWR